MNVWKTMLNVELGLRQKGNTTNSFDHLKKHHKFKYDVHMKAKAKANAGQLNPCPCPSLTQTTITAMLYPLDEDTEITDTIMFYLANQAKKKILWAFVLGKFLWLF